VSLAFWDESAIPRHWVQKKLKYVASLRSGDTISPEAIRNDGEYPVYGGNGFRGYTSDFTHEGDYVLIGRQGALCGNVNYAYGKFWASEHAIVADTKGKANVRWLGEVLRALNLNQVSQSAAQPGLAVDVIAKVSIPVPPAIEQQAIADYLDRETARVDALIAAKERLLGLLAEKRQALITRAVTRGLDPNAPMRDSGIPWLGPVPEHWETVALRFLVDIMSGATPDTGESEYWDGEIPWVSPKDMKRDEIADSEDHVTNAALADSALRLVPTGAVLVVVRGMILAHSFPVALTARQVTINQDMKALLCRPAISPHYLRDFLRGVARNVVSLADASAHGTRKLETEVLGRLQVCVPPIREQSEISERVAAHTGELDRLSILTAETIALLKERRAALIAAAVTGQIPIPPEAVA
jgi:type I restriction enzyme S subunit